MLLWILLAVVAVIALVLALAATRPKVSVIERSATLPLPAAEVYARLVDFRRWAGWSPWDALDPALVREYGGEASGVGATYYWRGNKQAGEGRMAIERAEAPRLVEVRLEFLQPFRNTSTAIFTLTPAAEGTHVTWTMRGPSPFAMRVVGLFINFDKLVGRDFERGLAALGKPA